MPPTAAMADGAAGLGRLPGLGLRASLVAPALDLVLRLRLLLGLPLHVRGIVGTALGERYDVIHHIARPSVRIARFLHESFLGRFTSLDAPMLVAPLRWSAALKWTLRDGRNGKQ